MEGCTDRRTDRQTDAMDGQTDTMHRQDMMAKAAVFAQNPHVWQAGRLRQRKLLDFSLKSQ